MDAERRTEELTQPIVQSWLGVVEQCVQSKSAFSELAKLCHRFYRSESRFMWQKDFKSKHFGDDLQNPRFAVQINKAFELVAIFGPYLFWKYPNRMVKRYDRPQPAPELFGDPNDPITGQLLQFVQQQDESEQRISEMRNAAMQMYLNYSQREQFGGGLESHAQLAICDALVKGRGCLWTKHYQYPGSDMTLTGCFFDSVDNLLIDPDCTDPTLNDAQFIIRKHTNSIREVERMFKLPRGALNERGSMESSKSQGGRMDARKDTKIKGKARDLMVWYEIFSKCGVGTRLKHKDRIHLEQAFDEVVGDYAYVCIAHGVDYPLNAHPERLANADDDEVRQMFDWPVPYWKDHRWPVSILDFYRDGECAWPIPPLSAGLGELICMNVLTSVAVSQTYENSRQIIGALASAAQDVEAALASSQSPHVIKINETVHKTVSDCIQFLQRPEINGDVWKTIDYLSMLFDKRTGLSEILYSMNPGGAQSRSAEDARIKQTNASVRPDYMATQVAKWMTTAAENEKLCAYWHVRGKDIQPLMGTVGAMIWEKYIESEDPEIVFREMRCTVEANDVKKPNKQREYENLSSMNAYLLPELSKHADATGDTEPLNAFIRDLGESMEQDTSAWQMGPRVPMPPDEEVAEAQKQQLQLENEKLSAEAEKIRAEAATVGADSQNAEMELAADMQRTEMELAADQAKTEQQMTLDARKAEQQIQLEREKAQAQLQLEREKASVQAGIQRQKAATDMQVQQAQAAQQMRLTEQQGQQERLQRGTEFISQLTQSRMKHAQDMSQAREQAKVKKKTAAKK